MNHPVPPGGSPADAPGSTAALLARLDRWVEAGWLRGVDRAFVGFLAEQVPLAPAPLLLAAALASHQLGRGHACLDLAAALDDPGGTLALPPPQPVPEGVHPEAPESLLRGLDAAAWQAALHCPPLVGEGEGSTPLVLDRGRLYLRRYWAHERSVRDALQRRLDAPPRLPPARWGALRAALDALFPPLTPQAPTDWQRLACALAARGDFAVITGGPGTGKTTTVVRLLAVLQALALGPGGEDRPWRIRLAAPTGKAAARLNESIAGAVRGLRLDLLPRADEIRAAIPTEVVTVHRLLGSRPDSRHFRHDEAHPLPVDLLVIDEASMVDLELMAAVVRALSQDARLVLLGDKDQLASVEAGAVLGDLCRRADAGHYDPVTADWLSDVAGQRPDASLVDPAGSVWDQAIVMLRHSHRFDAASGIGRLARAVNEGDLAALRRVQEDAPVDVAMHRADDGDAVWRSLVEEGGRRAFPAHGEGRVRARDGSPLAPPAALRDLFDVLHAGRPAADAPQGAFDDWARAVLRAQAGCQILCALREGPWGVEGLNRRIEGLLAARGLITPGSVWYLGRPVMVTRNDHGLGLMNGDLGVTLALPAREGGDDRPVLRVAFPAGDGGPGVRWVLPSRLQSVETVYAMTVHKSQGSEFAHAVLVLPPSGNPVLTRELVYTGITRARDWFSLVLAGPRGPAVLEEAVRRRVRRDGALRPDDGAAA
jgi:exodeoxyribonuclease V alpha subunit